MAKNLILCLCLAFSLAGCQSNKLTMPKGKWIKVNTADFIPSNVTKYSYKHEIETQDDVSVSLKDKEQVDGVKQ